MTKKELKRWIREEVRKELYEALPEMIEEAISNVLAKQKLNESAARKTTRRRRTNAGADFDPTRMKELIGYGDFVPGNTNQTTNYLMEEITPATTEKRHTTEVAGVPIAGGLQEYEEAAGMGPGFNDMPPELQQAIGKAKSVLDKADETANYRPGRK